MKGVFFWRATAGGVGHVAVAGDKPCLMIYEPRQVGLLMTAPHHTSAPQAVSHARTRPRRSLATKLPPEGRGKPRCYGMGVWRGGRRDGLVARNALHC